ncbi:acyl-CoA dehydrogenase [Alkalilimnicola sp. S0819]|uniref:acyl-CoA dehydrogenase n=1 Tax=Alkalilimnicola sp. S0819 TaxID=2613922 RepID=UPI0012622ADA|nr:acyl-CoA dehydrogenase [Alkalilimnicola sp. S0819]KAB7623621.1 acyl-CoA dehydrogenase [Alkalilimnicola sp. S0819]MPQ16745.1 acyl-CoA dehydrogenase [Alkalilimnicola sp. S0819]
MTIALWILALLLLTAACAFLRLRLWLSTLLLFTALLLLSLSGQLATGALVALWLIAAILLVPLNLPPLRRALLSDRILKLFRASLPGMSRTEQEALEAGTVWWDGELFSGYPRWQKLLAVPRPALSAEEQAFLDGPTEQLCKLMDDWEITHERMDLPRPVWDYIREQGFMGMIIPKEYGGLGFSALAHSEVVMKLATRSLTGAVTVMVPNSLGPAELLLHYGTAEQKNHYLPRLARGEEIPCFALTGPEAGSDAAAMPDTGVVCHGEHNGEQVIGLRLNWEKRYITLGPVATVLGLAFKVQDPERLLGGEEELGITCALIPTDTPGVEIGNRHIPLNIPFQNGPNSGRDVFIPLEWVIGGREMIGRGWHMLMDCLSAGRSISLPAAGTGGGKLATLSAGAYARVRRQFNAPVAEFEGVQEALGRIAGLTYRMDATRVLTATAVDLGEKPSVLSAIAKYHLSEGMRQVMNDAMDVHGGRGICLGPSNYLGRGYQGIPVSITVEGANILTRNLMIFGQGAIRCHPYLLREMQAAQSDDRAAFDRAFWGHIGFWLSNKVRSFTLGLTGGWLSMPRGDKDTRRYYRQLNRYSAAYALVADSALLSLGGALKRKESLSARLGDVLSYLYMASACLKHYEDQGRPRDDLPLLRWNLLELTRLIESRLDQVLRELPLRPLAWGLRPLVFPLGRHRRPTPLNLLRQLSDLASRRTPSRERLIKGAFRSLDPDDPIGRIEYAFDQALSAEPLEQRLKQARRDGKLQDGAEPIAAALATGLLEAAEAEQLRRAREARRAAIMVDDFAPDYFPKEETQ